MKEVSKKSKTYRNLNNRQTIPQNNSKKKRVKKNYALYYFLVLILMAVVFVALSLTVFFNITKISIMGSSVYSELEILDAAGVKVGDNIFRKKIDDLESGVLEKLVNIDYVKVSRKFPSELIIEIMPSVPIANVEIEDQYYTISKNWKIISDKHNESDENLPEIKGFEAKNSDLNTMLKSTNAQKEEILKTILSSIDNKNFKGVSLIDITDRLNIVLHFDNRIEIELGSSLDLDYKISFAKTIIDEHCAKDFEGKIIMRGDNGVSVIENENLD